MQYEIIPVTHYQQNCSLIWCEATKKAAVIDPGGEVERIVERIKKLDLSLDKIILTHGHMDHVGGAAALAKQANVPIVGPHKDDQFWLSMLDQQAMMMGFAAQEPLVPTQWLNDGDTVSVGDIVLDVFHCPGHTPGHVVLVCAKSRLAWVGDVLFKGSIGRTDFPRGDYQTLVNSIRGKLWPHGDDIVFVPGHGDRSTFGDERRTNPFVADERFG